MLGGKKKEEKVVDNKATKQMKQKSVQKNKTNKKAAKAIDREISKYPQTDIILASIGLIVGLVIAYLISQLLLKIPIAGGILSLLTYAFLGYLGIKIALKSKDDIFNIVYDYIESWKSHSNTK